MEFIIDSSKVGGNSTVGVRKKVLNGEFQLGFKIVNKVVLPRSQKKIVEFIVDLFLIKCLSKFDLICLLALMIKHRYKVIHVKERRHRMPYGYFLNKVFGHFGIVVVRETPGNAKKCLLWTH